MSGLNDFIKNLEKTNREKDKTVIDIPEDLNINEMMIGDRKASAALKGGQVEFISPESFTPKEIKTLKFNRTDNNEENDEDDKEDFIKEFLENNTNSNYEEKTIEEPKQIKIEKKPELEELEDAGYDELNFLKDIQKNQQEVKKTFNLHIKPKVETSDKLFNNKNENLEIKEEKPKTEDINKTPKIEEMSELDRVNFLFKHSDTPIEKKSIWLDYYYKAQKSRKTNPISERMKQGKFMITIDDQVVMLPDFDTYGKNSNEIMRQKWL